MGDDTAPAMLRLQGESERQSRRRRGGHGLARLFLGARTADRSRPRVHGGRRSRNRTPRARPADPERDDGAQPLAWRRPDRPDAARGSRLACRRWTRLRVVGVAADAQVTALGQIDPYYVYVPGEGSAAAGQGRHRRRDDGLGHPRRRAMLSIPTLLVTVLPLEATLGWSRGISGHGDEPLRRIGRDGAGAGGGGHLRRRVVSRSPGVTREIGVRLALGATAQRRARAWFFARRCAPSWPGARNRRGGRRARASRILSSVLFGVSPADPVGLGRRRAARARRGLLGGRDGRPARHPAPIRRPHCAPTDHSIAVVARVLPVSPGALARLVVVLGGRERRVRGQ